jgi:sulfur carrier protein
MKLVINGVVRETPDFGNVGELADWLKLPAFGSAVQHNGEVVRKADHADRLLKEGDRLEVVRLVGGG